MMSFSRLREIPKTLICLCSSSPFFASLIRNIGEFGAKNCCTGHRKGNTIQLFFSVNHRYLFLQLY